MTLKDIAKEAGVSISTVSRVINEKNTKSASKEVKDRIWEIVRRTGYTPNATARDLKLGRETAAVEPVKKSIACIFARTNTDSNDPFFSQIAKALEQEAFKNHYYLKYSFTTLDISNPEILTQISNIHVDGAVILGRYDEQLLKSFTARHKNVIYTGLNPIGQVYDQVVCDGYEAAFSAIKYLAELGHTKIGYIGEKQNEIRFQAYKDALDKLKLPYSPSNVVDVRLSSEGGYNGTNTLLARGTEVTAIFCANDTTAIGVLRALKENGISIPADMSVISIDDIDTAQYLSPMLTTVHIPLDELGQMAAKVLIDRISGGHRLPIKVTLPFYISKRESCAKLK
jgi:DNA-binding LacI/PurR family transcriptional regulator